MKNAKKKRTYEEMEQQFPTCQPVVVKTHESTSSSQNSDSGDDSENSTIVQQISPTASTTAIDPARRDTLQFLIGAKSLREMQFLY